MSQHIYHYHATFQLRTGVIHLLDGIVRMEKPIRDIKDYTLLKKLIVEDMEAHIPAKKLTIVSLTPLFALP